MQGVRSRDQVPEDLGLRAVMDLDGKVPPRGRYGNLVAKSRSFRRLLEF